MTVKRLEKKILEVRNGKKTDECQNEDYLSLETGFLYGFWFSLLRKV